MSGNNPSNDPLASVITQVQPGQGAAGGAAALRGGGPARPTRVAKAGTAKAAQQQQEAAEKKRKKKQQQAAAAAGTAASPQQQQQQQQPPSTAATASTASTGEKAAEGDSNAGAAAGPSSTPTASALMRQEGVEGHSNDPSSTLVGTTSTLPEGSAPAAEKGATPGAVGVGETDPAAKLQSAPTNEQDMTQAAQALQKEDDKATPQTAAATTATSKTKSQPTTSAAKQSSASRAPATAAAPSSKAAPAAAKKTSPLKKLIAFLTCSSGASAAMAAEDGAGSSRKTTSGEEVEMAERSGGQQKKGKAPPTSSQSPSTPSQKGPSAKRSNNKLAPPITTAGLGGKSRSGAGRSPSRPSSARNSLEGRSETGVVAPAPGTPTAGGGTMLPREETGDVMSGAVVPPGSSFVSPHDVTPSKQRGAAGGGAESESDVADSSAPAASSAGGDDDGDDGADESGSELVEDYLDDEELNEEQRLIAAGGMGIPKDEFGNERPLLVPLSQQDSGRKCLVLDLDETLVHSSFKMIQNADFIVPVEIEGTVHNVYVIKRPGVDEFMRLMGQIYEVVVFTASLSKYADPVLDILDIHRVVRHRLFRESCYNHRGNYVKDLSQLGRPIGESIIIDNSPASYIFHPNNAVPISSWFNDPHDTELTDLCPFLADLCDVHDVRAVLDGALAAPVGIEG